MSKQFYDGFVSLFFGLVVLLVLILASTEFMLFYLSTQNYLFYVIYCGTIVVCLLYGAKYFIQFRDFREKLYLLIPSDNENTSELTPLEIEDLEEIPLKACLYYRNHKSFHEIAETLGFNHPEYAKRELIRGLDILLRSYEKHEKKVSVS